MSKINDLQRLMETLGAKKETGNGWASWTIDCGPGKFVHTDLSHKPQATSVKRCNLFTTMLEKKSERENQK